MTLEQAIDAHRMYLDRWTIEGDSESRVLDHLPGDDEDALISSENPRIILASANFSKELTTSVLWLNQVGLDVTCVQLQPHKVGDSVFVERRQVSSPSQKRRNTRSAFETGIPNGKRLTR